MLQTSNIYMRKQQLTNNFVRLPGLFVALISPSLANWVQQTTFLDQFCHNEIFPPCIAVLSAFLGKNESILYLNLLKDVIKL
jgi:hypothetical protein